MRRVVVVARASIPSSSSSSSSRVASSWTRRRGRVVARRAANGRRVRLFASSLRSDERVDGWADVADERVDAWNSSDGDWEDEDASAEGGADDARTRRETRGARRRGRAGRRATRARSGYDASVNVLKLAYDALAGVSEAFTRALDVLLPSSVPMAAIRALVACGWGAFVLLSATRLIYGVVVVGSVLVLASALGNYRDDDANARRGAGMFEYATDSSARGRRRREDFDDRRRAAARERRRAEADERDRYDDDDDDDDDERAPWETDAAIPFDFDSRTAEALGDTFRAAQDVTEEVRQWGEEAMDEFKRAFNLNAGDFDFDDDVADVDFSRARYANVEAEERLVVVDVVDAPSPLKESPNSVQIIDVDAINASGLRSESESASASRQSEAELSFDDWLGGDGGSVRRESDFTASESPPPRDAPSREREDDDDLSFGEGFRDAFEGAFGGIGARTRTGAARNWLNEFVSGKFYGAFQEDLIDVRFEDVDEDDRNTPDVGAR